MDHDSVKKTNDFLKINPSNTSYLLTGGWVESIVILFS